MSWRKPRVSWPSSCPIRKPAILPPKRKKPSQVSRLIFYFLVFVSGEIFLNWTQHHDIIIRVFDYNFKSSMRCFCSFILLYRMGLTIPCRAWPFLSLSFFVFCFLSSSKYLEFAREMPGAGDRHTFSLLISYVLSSTSVAACEYNQNVWKILLSRLSL